MRIKLATLVLVLARLMSLAAPSAGIVLAAECFEDSGQHQLPRSFIAVDARRLMGSPDPLPLEAASAFTHLKFKRPVELTFALDGTNRLFVVEQEGIIRVFDNDPQQKRSKVFLDIRDRVLSDGNEEGLLGLAFHPK